MCYHHMSISLLKSYDSSSIHTVLSTLFSVGVSVDELLRNPDNEEWYKYAVEFCGGTHLTSTAGIDQLYKSTNLSLGYISATIL